MYDTNEGQEPMLVTAGVFSEHPSNGMYNVLTLWLPRKVKIISFADAMMGKTHEEVEMSR